MSSPGGSTAHLSSISPAIISCSRHEVNQETVIEYSPDSHQAACYRALAQRIMENTSLTIPCPLEIDALESLAREFI